MTQPNLIRWISAVFVLGLAIQLLSPVQVSANQISARSLTLQAGATDGGSKPGGSVKHFFQFTLPTGSSVGSIKFQYCTLAAGTCSTPTGVVTTGATLDAETGVTGFSMVNSTNGSPYLTRSASAIGANSAATYQLGSIVNPTTANTTFFVRISTYASTDTTGSATDTGSVAAATANPIVLTGQMPESLVFCTGETIGLTGGVPDCGTATPGNISFNQLFSPVDTATAKSQMAASTNAGAGYNITVNGTTMTSGSNTISAMGSATTGVRGISQFGLNLKANTTATSTVAVGTEVAPASNGTNYKGRALAGYNTADTFKFTTGESVADSATSGAGGSDSQIFTVSYIINVPGSQPAGTYSTTLTYICTPTF